jgi:serine/threonine protein kinase
VVPSESPRNTGEPKGYSAEEFLRNLADSGLLRREEAVAAAGALAGGSLPADGEALARALIAAGKLTPFQAAAVRERRFGELLLGAYEVLDLLGRGGMGAVYKARHRRMKRVVALKVLSPAVGRSATFVLRFQREVEAVARLSHPNIVMAFDAGEAEVGHFLVMEFIDGRDLASEVRGDGPLLVADAVGCIVQAARALEYAHAQGIIHRDVKPANLLRDARGVVKVADLGLARFHDPLGRPGDEAAALTQAGTVMGTVDYMSPEQSLGMAGVDGRTDVYSLGCTLFFLLAGRPPYGGETVLETLCLHREAPIPDLGETGRRVPAALEAVFHRMMAKKPGERFSSMTDVLRALEAVQLPPEEGPRPRATPNPPADAFAPTIDVRRAEPATPAVSDRGIADRPVLLVEPSRAQSAIIRKYLQEFGVRDVPTAATGRQALEEARRVRPRAVVSAMHLADMTGLQLAEQVRAEPALRATGFVLITSKADQPGANLPGNVVLLAKPFDPEGLAGALRRATAASTPAAPRDHLKVLIVDDSTAARSNVRGVLGGLGLRRFTEAADGTAAVALLDRESFDLVVTDYHMPGLDGRGLVEFIRRHSRSPSVPVLMSTTETNPARLEEVRQSGVSAICDKRFLPEVVRGLLESLLPRNA